jgi:hypothetical protein
MISAIFFHFQKWRLQTAVETIMKSFRFGLRHGRHFICLSWRSLQSPMSMGCIFLLSRDAGNVCLN